MWKTRPIWPASAAQAADWPRLAEAQGSLRHDLSLNGASGEPAGRGLSRLVFHIAQHPAALGRVAVQVAQVAVVGAEVAPARALALRARVHHAPTAERTLGECEAETISIALARPGRCAARPCLARAPHGTGRRGEQRVRARVRLRTAPALPTAQPRRHLCLHLGARLLELDPQAALCVPRRGRAGARRRRLLHHLAPERLREGGKEQQQQARHPATLPTRLRSRGTPVRRRGGG